ncbi:TonB-dependent receptor [Pseudomonas chlororaphis subsp. piscium]|uniref:TonB-dependent receptor n=1 Tax=Pseudomonas chlororaphis TaxID=587753 RepID=UPI000F577F05|nr:TonB-dependent receptor [Pseudomonas chlororaphis]AZD86858.1 Putative TonB-dependent receptor [Pseudomonas chlororaphis subsp. aureofaciens]UQS88721.1 TonB-dependent receptor [Pseudomonas chlororaphis subsp. piscium]
MALSHRTFGHGIGVFTLSTLLATPAALAQEAKTADKAGITLESFVVTGEKLERDLKNTAASVSVKTARDIDREDTGNASVSQVIGDVPNVIYTDSVGAPIIRGQDTQGPNNGQNVFWGGTVPRATINLDGHYLNYNEMFFGATSVWDVDSIEVFRGPQTTSQGANAIAGAIIVNTKDPTFTPEAAYQAEIGSYHSRRSSLAVSGPLLGEDLAGRLAVDYSGRDTFIDYDNPNFQRGSSDQDFRALNLRAKLLWLPSSIPGLETKFTYSHNDTNRPTQEAASAPFHKLEHSTTTMPSWEQDTNTSILDVAYDLDNGIKLFNQTQYSLSSVHRVTGAAGQGDADIRQKNASNESHITFGEQEDVVSGMGGLYYAHTKTDETLNLRGLSAFDDTKENFGLFGELHYRLTERWTLSTGLRYQQDRIERLGNSVLAPQALDYQKTFSAVLPKVSLAYAVTPQWTVGALVSRGYNPGGVSLNLSTRQWAYFKEESIWNYELFTRANLLDDRLILSSNLFYMDFKDAQYNIPVVISPGVAQSYTINAEKAHAYGLELAADYRLLDNLTLKASAGTLRTRIDKISSNAGYEHNEFARSPGYTLSIGPSWDITDRLNVNAQVRYLDGYYSDTANTSAYSIKPYTLTDARMSYRFNDQVQLYGYVKNVFDDRSPTYMQENRGIGGIEASMTQPRTVGVGVKGTF